MEMEKIKEIAISEMKHKSSHPFKEPGNKYYHGQRVGQLVCNLCKALSYNGDTDVLVAAAWFHDICNGTEQHEALGAEKTFSLLRNLCTEEEAAAVRDLIAVHDSRELAGLPMAAQILQDADLLDHFGTFEVWNTVQYALKEELSMTEAAGLMTDKYRDEREQHRNLLHFELSRKIYDEKREYVRQFASRMLLEGSGQVAEPQSNGWEPVFREAVAADAAALKTLYFEYLTHFPPQEKQDMNVWAEMLEKFRKDPNMYLLVAEVNGSVVSSVQMAVVESLTHNVRPFAVIENVVTHADYRNRGYASALLEKASEIAKRRNCYKVFLETGSNKESTLNFYRNNGFTVDAKHSCLKRL